MRILYGIQGTGNGHLSRSSKIINKLKKLGCDHRYEQDDPRIA